MVLVLVSEVIIRVLAALSVLKLWFSQSLIFQVLLESVYKSIELQCIYKMTPKAMEKYYTAWETKWNLNGKDINNPKVPLKYVLDNGSVVWMHNDDKKYEIPKIPKRTKTNKIDLLDL